MERKKIMGALLQTVYFKDCSNWSVAHLLESQFNYNKDYELVRIGDFLTRNKNRIDIQDDIEYKRVTIRMNNNGIALRDKVMGKDIGTKKQFLIKKGQFLLSKIDARNGAFGLATDEVDGAIITADFFAYEIDKSKIEPYFLVLITTTHRFQNFAQSASSGTTGRQRIDEKKFLDVKIPLPTLNRQKEIVEAHQNRIKLAVQQELQVKGKEKEIEEYLYKQLGMQFEVEGITEHDNLLKFKQFKNLKNWSSYLKTSVLTNESNKFPMIKLSDLSPISSGGTPSRSKPEYYINGTIPWIKTGEVRDEIIYNTEEKITDEALKNSSAKIYPKDSLIIAMYGATAGRTAKLGIEACTNQACAVLYSINTNKVNIDFLWFYLMTQLHNFKLLAAGSAQPNLNSLKIKNYEIPLPPLDIQNKIVIHMQALKYQMKELKALSKQNKFFALEEFEREIFNED